jgi:hypothetical protein
MYTRARRSIPSLILKLYNCVIASSYIEYIHDIVANIFISTTRASLAQRHSGQRQRDNVRVERIEC